ncbi:MAG TPA: hypothetical protein VH561_15765 [Micromonosporaceae bacterium]|jgi:hypothetical protein
MAGELVRVVSDHVPVNDGTRAWPKACAACGQEWPCYTFQRQLQGQSGNRADRMRAHMTLWSLRMLSRPELAFIGPEIGVQLFDWIDNAVAAQEAVDRARRAVQARAQSAASRFAGRAWTAAGRFVPLGGTRQYVEQAPGPEAAQWHAVAQVDAMSTVLSRTAGVPDRSGNGAVWRRIGPWRHGRGRAN